MLPPEILSTIFGLVQEEILCAALYGAVNPDSRRYNRWTTVLRICRRWREVGFATPSLWKTVFVVFIPREPPCFNAEAHLQRSAACPLRVFIDSWASRNTIFKVLCQLPRIRELTLDQQTNGLLTLPMMFSRPGPALEVLTLLGGMGRVSESVPKLFSRVLPHLPALALSRYSRFTVYTLPNLKHLHVHRCTVKSVRAMESLLEFLANTRTSSSLPRISVRI